MKWTFIPLLGFWAEQTPSVNAGCKVNKNRKNGRLISMKKCTFCDFCEENVTESSLTVSIGRRIGGDGLQNDGGTRGILVVQEMHLL